MGIFKKSNKDNLFLLFPDGREVKSPDDFKEIREKYSFSPSTLADWRLHKVDIKPCSDAAAVLASVGIPSNESIIAFGPVKLYEFPKSHNEYIAKAVLTPLNLVIYYYPAPIKLEYLIVRLQDITGLTTHGSWTATFSFNKGTHIKKKKIFELHSTYFGLSEILGKDGHENRRSVTLIDSLAKTLNEIGI